MIILGIICAQGHASSAVLLQDGKILAAMEEERFSRIKFDDSPPWMAIDYIIHEFSIDPKKIDAVAFAWNPFKTFKFQIINFIKYFPDSLSFVFSPVKHKGNRSRLWNFIRMICFPFAFMIRYRTMPRFSWIDHHLAHAYSVLSQVPVKDGPTLIAVADGVGESDSTSIYLFKDSKMERIFKKEYPHSLGLFYSAVTEHLGFTPDSDEYKVMGLSSYGKGEKRDLFHPILKSSSGDFNFHEEYVGLHLKRERFSSDHFAHLVGASNTFHDQAEIAYAAQRTLEETVINLLTPYVSGVLRVATSGGVFLNCVLNQKIREAFPHKQFTFFPVAEDNGSAIGAALCLYHRLTKRVPEPLSMLYLGFLDDHKKIDLRSEHKHLLKVTPQIKLSRVAELIASSKVIAWMQGRTEFGPRALGNRSILGDPRRAEMKDIINKKIKMRESFRPFAPSILHEELANYFLLNGDCTELPYMIETVFAKESAKASVPAVVHVDGTSRVHSVKASINPRYHELISEFKKITGVPIILNTSFNLSGMPIVNSVDDAIECFLKSELDYLVIDDNLIERI